MSKVLRRGGNETVFRTAVTTVGPDSESAEPGDATVPGNALDRSTGVRTTTTPALLLERLDGALATAENTVLSPVHRFQHWVEEDLRETRGTGPREPLYVSFLKMPRAAPVTVLVVMILGYIAVFGTLTYRQQSNYGTFGFDMGIYDQGIWLTSRFKDPFVTIMGLGYFGHHVNLITLLFIPAYWLGAGPHFLYAVETVWLAAGAVPVWLLARDRLHSSWVALGLAAAYLLYPSVEWINWWHFHPDALIITPLMFAYWLATRRRWGWFWAAIAVALSCKEDAGLAVFALGICLWVKHHERTRGLLTALAGGGWFLVCTKLIIPLSTGGGDPFYITFFPGFGTSIFSIMTNFVVHPSRWVKLVVARSRWQYYAQVFWPVVLLPLLEPLVLLIAVPQLFVNTVSAQSTTRDIHFYYTAIVTAGIFLATIEACAKRGRTAAGRRFMVGLVVAAALASNVAWGPSPISVDFHSGIWAQPGSQDQAINRAISIVPKDAAVSATYDIDDHMTHRVLIYEFPNPWIVTNWLTTKTPPDPSKVDWLVLDTRVTGQSGLYEALALHEFKVVFNEQGIVVLHRVRPGVPDDHHWP